MLPNNELFESIRAIYEASEGDARKYMKKELINLGLEEEMEDSYGPNWSEEVFRKLRKNFVRLGCDMYFLPGIARIAYGDLDYDSDDEDTLKVATLRDLVKFITIAHKGDFTRNLERIDVVTTGPQKGMKVKSNPLSFDELKEMFAKASDEMDEAEENEWEKNNVGKTPNGYQIIVLKDFETANKFYPYTVTDDPHTAWCYLESEDAFESYSENGNKLYLALKPGFEKLKPGDPGYGDSMIGFDMGPVNEKGKSKLCVSTNRYNHGTNLETGESGGGDSAYTKTELADILGLPIWKSCPGYTTDELLANGRLTHHTLEKLFPDNETLLKLASDEQAMKDFETKYNVKFARLTVTNGNTFEFYRPGFFTQLISYVLACKNTGKPIWYKFRYKVTGSSLFGLQLFDDNYVLVDADDNLVTSDKFKSVYTKGYDPIGVELADNRQKLRCNFINEKGKYISDTWFEGIEPFNRDGIAKVKNEGKTALIDKTGHFISPWAESIDILGGRSLAFGGIQPTMYRIKTSDGFYLYDSNMKPCFNFPMEDIGDYGEYLVLRYNNKLNIYTKNSKKLLCNEWFDHIRNNSRDELDLSFHSEKRNSRNPERLFIVYDSEKGYRLLTDSNNANIPTQWFESIRPYFNQVDEDSRQPGYLLFEQGDKINFFDMDRNQFVSDVWFTCDSNIPDVTYGAIRGLYRNGVRGYISYDSGYFEPEETR